VTGFVPLAIAAVGAVALAVLLFALLAPEERPVLLGRLRRMSGEALPEEEETQRTAPAEALRAGLQATFGTRFERSDRGTRMADDLARANLRLRPAEWISIVVAVCVVVGGLVALRFASPIGFVIGAAAGYAGCLVFLKVRQGRRRRAFDNQLSATILGLSNGIKAGYTFAQAVDLVSRTAQPPMAGELGRMLRQMQLGVPLVEALARMVERNESDDLRLMLTAVQIQQQAGGNLAQVLDNIEITIRERVRIKGEIKTLTSQARVSGWILTGLPFGLAGVLTLTAPTYFTPMFSNLLGQIMLGMAGLSLICGFAIIRKIVNVRV
jgi:tight adherence protein B